jgi:hypothetical protein
LLKEHLAGPYKGRTQEDFKRVAKQEIGSVLWTLAAVAVDLGTSLEECALINLVKLRDRKEAGTIQGAGDER